MSETQSTVSDRLRAATDRAAHHGAGAAYATATQQKAATQAQAAHETQIDIVDKTGIMAQTPEDDSAPRGHL